MSRYVVITDLDGTLLDENYSYEDALPTLKLLKMRNVPIVFCSSKTRLEQEYYRSQLGIKDPFIVENGAAIYLPVNLFNKPCNGRESGEYYLIELGISTTSILEKLSPIMDKLNRAVRWLHEMSIEEVMKVTGLPRELAMLAVRREYSLVFKPLDKNNIQSLLVGIEQLGLRWFTGGRLYIINGMHDKGVAVKRLIELYRSLHEELCIIGVGNSHNDVPFLKIVDVPVLLGSNETVARLIGRDDLVRIDLDGPKGWSIAVKKALKL